MKKRMFFMVVLMICFFSFSCIAKAADDTATTTKTETYCRYQVGDTKGANALVSVWNWGKGLINKEWNFLCTVVDGSNCTNDWVNALGAGVKEYATFDIVDTGGTASIVPTASSKKLIAFTNQIDNDDFYKDGKFKCPKQIYSVYKGADKEKKIISLSIYSDTAVFSLKTYNKFNRIKNVTQRTIDSNDDDDDVSEASCEGILGGFKEDLENILKIIRIVGPILVFIYSSWDYLSAIFMKDDEQLKKANSKLIKRLILVALLFFLPILLDLLLGIIDSSYTTCIN